MSTQQEGTQQQHAPLSAAPPGPASLWPGERRAPRRYWAEIGPRRAPVAAADAGPQTEAAIAADARIAADRATLEELATIEATVSRMQARATVLRARLTRSAIAHAGSNLQSQSIELRSMAREVAAMLTVTHGVARRGLKDALTITGSFPTLVEAQARGDVTARQATTIADEALVLCDGTVTQSQRDEYVADAVAAAPGLVPAKLKIVARTLAERIATLPVTVRHERALEQRHVAVSDADDGMAYLTAYLPAVQAHAIKDRLDTGAAGQCADDPRTRDQWRADALSAVLLTGDAADPVHEHCDDPECIPRMLRGIRATVAITVPMLSLADDSSYQQHGPAILNGHTPVSVTTAAALIGPRHAMQRWLTDPVTGQVAAVDTRFASKQLLRQIHARDGARCRQPSCGSTRVLQTDHNTRWTDGGETSLANSTRLCPSCHIVKDNTAWQQRLAPDGTVHWRSPLGYEYADTPIAHGPPARIPAYLLGGSP